MQMVYLRFTRNNAHLFYFTFRYFAINKEMKQGYRNLSQVSESDEETVLELQSSDAESSSDDESVSSENYIASELHLCLKGHPRHGRQQ